MGEIVPTLSAEKARALTDQVREDATALWAKLLQLHDGGAHTALGYASWGAYFEEEFGESATKAYRLLRAARVVAELPMGNSLPNERQARELARVEPARRAEVWREASANGAPTAARIREVSTRTPSSPDPRETAGRIVGWANKISSAVEYVGAEEMATALRDGPIQGIWESYAGAADVAIKRLEAWRTALRQGAPLRRVK